MLLYGERVMQMPKQFRVIIAAVLLIAAIIVLVILLFTPQPLQIILETGQEVSTKSSNYFTIASVMILVVCSFVIGATITYLFYNSDNSRVSRDRSGPHVRVETDGQTRQVRHLESEVHEQHSLDLILPLLREDEKKAVRLLRDSAGEMLQNELVLKLGLSKVKTTRILAGLERKQIIAKNRHGLTNHIRLLHTK